MQQFIDWVVNNWQFVSTIAASVISFILLLIFRRSKSFLVDDGLHKEVLYLVIEAEKLFGSGHGKEKLDYVLTKIKSSHPSWQVIDVLPSIVKKAVDDILSSPQKKGGK